MNRFKLATALLIIAAASCDLANAEPYLAVQTGVKCMACHVSPTGGGMRTNYGSIVGQTSLASRPPISVWDGTVTDRLQFGGDIRANAQGTRIPNQDNRFEFNLEEALLYAEFKLIPEKLSLYFDERVAPGGASSREAYALFWFKDKSAYVRAGRMFLPYGWRLEDDTAFIRQVPGINYTTPDDGIEFGLEGPRTSVNLALTNGNAGAGETDRGKQISLRGSYVQTKWRLGASLNYNDVDNAERSMANIFAGVKTGKVSWLAEVDFVNSKGFVDGSRKQIIGLLEANFWARQGHNVKLSYEFFDPDDTLDEDERNRYSLVWEHFPMQFLQVILGIRINDGIPQNDLQNTEEAFLQLHTYF